MKDPNQLMGVILIILTIVAVFMLHRKAAAWKAQQAKTATKDKGPTKAQLAEKAVPSMFDRLNTELRPDYYELAVKAKLTGDEINKRWEPVAATVEQAAKHWEKKEFEDAERVLTSALQCAQGEIDKLTGPAPAGPWSPRPADTAAAT